MFPNPESQASRCGDFVCQHLLRFYFASLVLCVTVGIAGCRASGYVVANTDPISGQLERQLHDLVNLHREQQGLPALRYSPELTTIAREHSRAMAEGTAAFGHDGIAERMQHAGRRVPLLFMGENLLLTESGESVAVINALAGWLASPSHRKTVEGCFDLAGVGMARSARGRVYFTQLFVLTRAGTRACNRA